MIWIVTYGNNRTWKSITSIIISGKAQQIEADKLCNESKTLQDYMRHVEQQSHGHKTNA